ncbi:AAA family ATPase [Gloeomargaritales cyanobacterium VI4D9]|nr:AAA family ATPase [Gloeomargaritales cyanobacterium VI4D9]
MNPQESTNAVQIKQFKEFPIPEDWRFVPIRQGSKAPVGTGWQNSPLTWNECPKPGSKYQGQNVGAVGLLFGYGGIVGLDFDGASTDQLLADWGVTLPATTIISSGRAGHCLKLFRIPEKYRDRVQTAKYRTGVIVQEYGKDVHEQLEIRWTGSQSLVYGTHPESGNQYKVLNWVDNLPELPPELLYRMLKPEEKNHQAPPGHTFTDQEWALEYLQYIDPNPLDWYTWRDCLFACHAAGLSEAEVRAWSSQSGKHTDRGFDQVWRHIKGRPGIGLGTLGWLAKQGGWEPKPKPVPGKSNKVKPVFICDEFPARIAEIATVDEFHRPPKIAELSRDSGIPYSVIEKAIQKQIGKAQNQKIEAIDAASFLAGDYEPLQWLIEGLLPTGEIAILGATPKAGKTIFALNAAYSVATGTPFLGMETKQGAVLLVSTDESANSTRSKMLRMGFSGNMPVAVLTQFDIQNLEPLIAALEKFKPVLVVVDSLKSISKSVTESENSPEFANYIYKLKEVFSAYNCASILIHHTGKSKDNEGVYRLRGGSAIAGASWGIWLLSRTGENSVILETICRDAEGETLTLHLNLETLHWTRQGEPPPSEGAFTDKVLSLLKTRTNPSAGLEVPEIKNALGENGNYIYNVLTRLCEKRLIGRRESHLNKGKFVYFYQGDSPYKGDSLTKLHHTHLKVNNDGTSSMVNGMVNGVHHFHHQEFTISPYGEQPIHHSESPCPSDFEAPMVKKSQIPPYIDSQQIPAVENVSTKCQEKRMNNVYTQDCRICVGDFVRYVGGNQSLRVQCGHSRREGVRVTAIDGGMAFIKSPKWICDYKVPIAELVKDRRERVAPAKVFSAVGGTDDDTPF